MKVIFYRTLKSSDKIKFLVKTAKEHFESKKTLIFLTSDPKSAEFVDDILWQSAPFLPHIATNENTDEVVIISNFFENANSAKYIFNLTKEPLNLTNFRTIYEFDDATEMKKKFISKKKFNFYHSQKIQIEQFN